MNQRSLFVVLFAGLLVACEDDSTLLDLNAVSETKYCLLASAEYALRAADQADTLAARLAVFANSAVVFANSAYAYADSALSAETLFAANAYAARFALSKAATYTDYATRNGGGDVIYEACDAVLSPAAATAATEAYKVARRAAVAAFQAYAAAYDARNARLAPRAYKVAWRATEKTAFIARRAASQAAIAQAYQASADSLYATAQASARHADEAYAAYIDSIGADQASSDKATRLRHAYKKDAAAQATKEAATARRVAAQAANKATTARRAAVQAANKAEQAAKVYAEQVSRLRRAYKKDAVQAAYDVACAAAYDATYQAYNDNDGLDDADQDARMIASDASIDILRFPNKAERYVYATYVDPAAVTVAYETASALFDAAYRTDGDDPQAYAAQAYAAAAKEAGRIAARDFVYVKSPISIAIAALATSSSAYRAYATYIDSILKSHQVARKEVASNLFEHLERTEDITDDVSVGVEDLTTKAFRDKIVLGPDEYFEGSMTEFKEKHDEGNWLIIDKSGFLSNEVLAMQKMAVKREIEKLNRLGRMVRETWARAQESPEDRIERVRRNLHEAVQVISSPENKENEEVCQAFITYVEDPESEDNKDVLRFALEERLGDKETAQEFLDFLETEEGWKAMSPFVPSIFAHQYKDIPLMQKRDGRR